MTVNTFKIAVDLEDGRRYVYQYIDEADKNHHQGDTTPSNKGRIYEVPGEFCSKRFSKKSCLSFSVIENTKIL